MFRTGGGKASVKPILRLQCHVHQLAGRRYLLRAPITGKWYTTLSSCFRCRNSDELCADLPVSPVRKYTTQGLLNSQDESSPDAHSTTDGITYVSSTGFSFWQSLLPNLDQLHRHQGNLAKCESRACWCRRDRTIVPKDQFSTFSF
jgi:hypothetical protein